MIQQVQGFMAKCEDCGEEYGQIFQTKDELIDQLDYDNWIVEGNKCWCEICEGKEPHEDDEEVEGEIDDDDIGNGTGLSEE